MFKFITVSCGTDKSFPKYYMPILPLQVGQILKLIALCVYCNSLYYPYIGWNNTSCGEQSWKWFQMKSRTPFLAWNPYLEDAINYFDKSVLEYYVFSNGRKHFYSKVFNI